MARKKKSAKLQINEETDDSLGQCQEYEEFVYYMMNKPCGVSATEDPKHKTVLI